MRPPLANKIAPATLWATLMVFSFHYAREISRGGNSWKTGDWLINYEAGPVRRGFIGTILLNASDAGLPLLWMTFTIQVALYCWMFLSVIQLYRARERDYRWLIFIYSPAFLLFPLYDLQGGFRKEIIVLAAFAFLCSSIAKQRLTTPRTLAIIATYGIAVLSHEASAFTLPFFLYALRSARTTGLIGPAETRRSVVALTLLSGTAVLVSGAYPGTAEAQERICNSLISKGLDPSICEGAIVQLQTDSLHWIALIRSIASEYLRHYPVLLALSIAPMFLIDWSTRKSIKMAIFGLVPILPLYVLAIDWGRWIHIQVSMTFCIIFMSNVDMRIKTNPSVALLIMIYLTTWTVPHCCANGISSNLVQDIRAMAMSLSRYMFE